MHIRPFGPTAASHRPFVFGALHTAFLSQVLVIATLPLIVGCGGSGSLSQADLKRYAIDRGGSDDDEAEEQPVVLTPPAVASPSAVPATTAAATAAVPTPAAAAMTEMPTADPVRSPGDRPVMATTGANTGNRAVDSSDVSSGEAVGADDRLNSEIGAKQLATISQRKPAVPLDETARRKRSAQNIERLLVAVNSWIDNSRMLPESVLKDAQGRKSLSWRVHILPLLGHQSLYDKFNLNEPWDSPNNKALLPYIPDEFISPERFDTNTNYQLFVNGIALFSESETRYKTELSDAPNVLMLAEVDEQYAVPWTSPFDYDVTEKPLDRGLGRLRKDGFFCGWMSGQVALWPKPVNLGHLHKAITFEAGDRFPMELYQSYPPVGGFASRPSVVSGGSEQDSLAPRGADALVGTPDAMPVGSQDADMSSFAKISVPRREAILAAEEKVKRTYEDEFKRARSSIEYSRLATRIHDQLTSTTAPPEDVYVGLRTAMNVAIRGRDPDLALRILEEFSKRFDIDRSQFESLLIAGFLGDNGSLRTELSKAAKLLPMIEQLVELDVQKDRFSEAEEKVDYCAAVLRTVSDRETIYRWKVLKQRVAKGKRLFPGISKHLQSLGENADDPAANQAVGWYFCVIKRNWTAGLEFLAKTQDPEIRLLAQLELQGDGDLTVHLRLGNSWYDFALQNKKDDLVFEAAMSRARKWYRSASIGLPDGLDRIHANNRIDKINGLIGKPLDATGVPSRSL